jgi:hypothetical protein
VSPAISTSGAVMLRRESVEASLDRTLVAITVG